MLRPDVGTLLDAWDGAQLLPAGERGPWLVDRLDLVQGFDATELTVGQCDRLLAECRAAVFGTHLDVVYRCIGCRSENEGSIALRDLWPDGPPDPAEYGTSLVEIDVAGRVFSAWIPSNRDLSDLARLPREQRAAQLVRRCLVSEGEDPSSPLSADVTDELIGALADRDRGAFTPIEFRCACGFHDIEEFDIRSFLWAELTAWAERTLTEVHQLASAYGWREAEILALSPQRRQTYLELCQW